MSYGIRKDFYHSPEWKACRKAYLASVGGLCEECMKLGLIRAASTVHHKVHLTEDNITDPVITLGFDNLEAVCMDCHAKLHGGKRYRVDAMGRVVVKY